MVMRMMLLCCLLVLELGERPYLRNSAIVVIVREEEQVIIFRINHV